MNLANLFNCEPHVRSLLPGEALFVKGEMGVTVYVVLEGSIDVVVDDQILEVATRGSILGEMALIDHSPRSASAIASTPCRVAEISHDRFLFLVSQTPNFALQVMKIMSERLRHMDERTAALAHAAGMTYASMRSQIPATESELG